MAGGFVIAPNLTAELEAMRKRLEEAEKALETAEAEKADMQAALNELGVTVDE